MATADSIKRRSILLEIRPDLMGLKLTHYKCQWQVNIKGGSHSLEVHLTPCVLKLPSSGHIHNSTRCCFFMVQEVCYTSEQQPQLREWAWQPAMPMNDDNHHRQATANGEEHSLE